MRDCEDMWNWTDKNILHFTHDFWSINKSGIGFKRKRGTLIERNDKPLLIIQAIDQKKF